jgi:hypothetical protein
MSHIAFRTELIRERNAERLCAPADLAAVLAGAGVRPAFELSPRSAEAR